MTRRYSSAHSSWLSTCTGCRSLENCRRVQNSKTPPRLEPRAMRIMHDSDDESCACDARACLCLQVRLHMTHGKYIRAHLGVEPRRTCVPCTVHRDMCSKALRRARASGVHSALHERIRNGIQAEEERRGAMLVGFARVTGAWTSGGDRTESVTVTKLQASRSC